MKACRVHTYGPPSVISVEEIDRPQPGEGEVLVRVNAAGVGPWDAWIRAGKSALPQPLPLTLGSDLSGVVEAAGPAATGFEAGMAVFGATNKRFIGAYAEYAIASAGMMAKKPASLDDIKAASVPVIAITAQQALFEHAKLGAGQTVLIHGAAGNVGAYAVQLAREAELQIIATAGAADIDMVRALGADQVIDFRKRPFEDAVKGADAVIDLVGGETQSRSFGVLKPGGRLVSAVSKPDEALAAKYGVSALFFLVDVTTAGLQRISDKFDQGALKAYVGKVLPLAEAQVAHEILEGNRPKPGGKIVLKVNG